MEFTCQDGPLEGLKIIRPAAHRDARGLFMETYHTARYRAHGIVCKFVQDNLSRSRRGTLRGLHYQLRNPQAKLVMVVRGSVFDVAVDFRRQSSTFGQWYGQELNDEDGTQMFVPEGFAHGFCVLSDEAIFAYKCSTAYDRSDERGILWSDPDIGIQWPVQDPILSSKDKILPVLACVAPEELPRGSMDSRS